MKLSLIVPIYNVEKYLRECIDSLINQDLPKEDYEIILVDDGSTDSSLSICKEYADKFTCIKLISQTNQGLSAARNAGLKHASGEYVMFIDSDDHIVENKLNTLYCIAKENSTDLLFYNFIVEYVDKRLRISKAFTNLPKNRIFTGVEFCKMISDFGSVCRIFFRRAFLDSNNLWFTHGISREDCDFNIRSFPLANRIMIIDENIYYYRFFGESLTRTQDLKKKQHGFFSNFVVIKNAKQWLKENRMPKEIIDIYKKNINSMIVGACVSLYRNRQEYGKEFCRKCINYGIDNNIFPIKGVCNSWKSTFLSWIINLVLKFYR